MNQLRIGTAIGIFVLAFLLGGFLGGWAMRSIIRDSTDLFLMMDAAHLSGYVRTANFNGTPAAYEDALRDYATLLERRKNRAWPSDYDRINAVDLALTYARLAAALATRGDLSGSQRYLSAAEQLCPRMTWKKCSAGVIAEFAARVDQKTPWADAEDANAKRAGK